MPTESKRLALLSRMFSATVTRSLADEGRSALLGRLLSEAGFDVSCDSLTVEDALDSAFALLRRTGNRDDHVYRSALVQKLYLGRHTARTATAMFETRASNSRADLVILNGTSTAYEIKSDRDSLARLHDQLQNYRQLWAAVNVVTSPSQALSVCNSTPADVGVIVLSDNFTLQTLREAEVNESRVSPLLLLDSLRNAEAESVLISLGIPTPGMPNTALRRYYRTQFASLDPEVAHAAVLRTLKQSRRQTDATTVATALPIYLRAPAIAQQLTRTSYARLRTALSTPLSGALQWS